MCGFSAPPHPTLLTLGHLPLKGKAIYIVAGIMSVL